MTTNSGPTLQELVLRLKGDRSYDALEKAAGGIPTSRALQKLVNNGFTRMPNPETFRGLSRALNVSQRELVLAAARTLGIDIEAENPNDLLLIGAGRLPQKSQDLLTSTSRELQRWMDKAAQQADSMADVYELFPEDRMAADKGQPGVDPEQLPED
ncbi:hypothetical protein [Glutamicibacter creatinolyticus]|uniref:hypothetical protein n=1 Tax=Glutamicibacter creatinolyticus TaxID=162496 RepID=UPI0031D230F0